MAYFLFYRKHKRGIKQNLNTKLFSDYS